LLLRLGAHMLGLHRTESQANPFIGEPELLETQILTHDAVS